MGNKNYKVGVVGVNGRMGQVLCQKLQAKHDEGQLEFLGGSSRQNSDAVSVLNVPVMDVEELFEACDCVIDFTKPEALGSHLKYAQKFHTSLVFGTTGLSKAQEMDIKDAADIVPIVYAANMSIGVNLMLAVVEKVAAALDEDFDIEIFEAHHRHKIDSPSGTALAIGKAAAKGRNVSFEDVSMSNMGNREGARKKGDIGFAVVRGGDVIGEHTAGFYGENERFEITHKASDRALFAAGAIKAAQWLKGKSAGLYSMRDVLDI